MSDQDQDLRCTLQKELEQEALNALLPTLQRMTAYFTDPNGLEADLQEFDGERTGACQTSLPELEEIKKSLAKKFNETLWDVVGDSLFRDQNIASSAKILGVEATLRIVKNTERELAFSILEADFKSWLETHQDDIGIKFNLRRESYRQASNGASQERSVYVCECGCSPLKPSSDTPNGKSGKNLKRAPNLFSECRSRIVTTKQSRTSTTGDTKTVVNVRYRYQHNHAVGMKDNIETQRKYQIIWRRISELMQRGEDIQHILYRLTIDQERFLQYADGTAPKISLNSFITYDDIYYVLYHIVRQEAHKDGNPIFSANKWMEQLSKEGFFTYHNRQGKFYSFSSHWQLEQLQKYGDVFYFNGSKVCGNDIYIFSVIVQSRVTGTGVPVAFFITCKLDPEDISHWLYRLRKKLKAFGTDFKPAVIITDQGSAEIRAIRKVFSTTKVFYSGWSLLQTWERIFSNEKLGIAHLPKDKKEAIRAKLRNDLRTILYDTSKKSAMERVKDFRLQWSAHPYITEYLDRDYFNEDNRKQWMLCYKQNSSHGCIDINNGVESWHHTIESYFFKENRSIRADSIIYILARMVFPNYQKKQAQYTLHTEGVIQAQQKLRNARLDALDVQRRVRATGLVHKFVMTTSTPSILLVRSFTNPQQTHKLTFEKDEGLFTGCSCLDYSRSKSCCKHISLAMQEIPFTGFEDRSYLNAPFDDFVLVEPLLDQDEELESDPAALESLSLSSSSSIDMLSFYIRKVYELEQARDTEVKLLPNERDRLESLMKQVYEFSSECFVLKESQHTETKHQI